MLFPGAKFRPPWSGTARPAAAAAIAEGLARVRLVTVVAPAGSGKTTALAAWASDPGEWRPLWVSLDRQDDDAVTLARALAAAVHTATGTPPARLTGLLHAEASSRPEHLATALVNDLDQHDPVAIVLDDLHALSTTPALDLVDLVLEGMGPGQRLLVGSRNAPSLHLARRRVRREVLEVGPDDLRLGPHDVAALLGPGTDPRSPRVSTILDRSGGWAAAADPSSTPTAAAVTAIDEFLRTEVLAELGPALARFALVNALLPALDPEACRLLSEDPSTPDHLDELARRGLLVHPGEGDTAGEPSRFPDHLAELLRRELVRRVEGDELEQLHRRAAALSPPGWAIELLLAIGDDATAANLVVEAGREALDRPAERLPRHWLRLLAELPADRTTATGSWLDLLIGLARLDDGDVPGAVERLDGLPEAMRRRHDELGTQCSIYGLAEAHLILGDTTRGASLLEELLVLATGPDDRVRVLVAACWLAYFRTDWDRIGTSLEEAFALALGPGRALGRHRLALGLGTEFLFAPPGPAWLLDRVAELDSRIGDDLPARTALRIMSAAGHLLAGRTATASELLDRVDEQALEMGGLGWLGLMADRVRLLQALASGDHDAVDRIVAAARSALDRSDRHQQERGMYAYALARSGRQRQRADLVQRAELLLGPVQDQDRPDIAVTAAVVSALAARLRGDTTAALARLDALGDREASVRFCLMTGIPGLERAGALLECGRRAEALVAARPALTLVRDLDAPGIVLAEGPGEHHDVLALAAEDPELGPVVATIRARAGVAGTRGGIQVPDTGEWLTARELEVLDLVVDGLSNREVADRLYIGERTVKTHMTAILRKLAVPSRTAAAARARTLRAVPSSRGP